MPERGGGVEDSWPDGDNAEGGYGPEEQLRRALAQERHAREARRIFEDAPFYRIEPEENGTVSLRRKGYEYWPARPPAAATRWRVLSTHSNLEEAERRLRLIASPAVHYDERGRLARSQAGE